MANAAVSAQLWPTCADSLCRAQQPKASNTAAMGLLAYSHPKTSLGNASATASPLHWTEHSPSSQGTISRSLLGGNGCYRRSSECSSMQRLMSQNQNRELLNDLTSAWLVAKILFMEWPNAVSRQALSKQVLLVPASSALSFTALCWRVWCSREVSSTCSQHRTWAP